MQLTVETEAALDIERDMSTVEDIQDNKENNLNIEALNDIKCNGNNKVKDVNTTATDEGSKQVISEIESALANIPIVLKNNEAEISNVDLSEIISKQSNLESNDTQLDESQNVSLEKETNGIDVVEEEIINEPEETPEEDYMEDDIISIREEPYNIISDSLTETENIVTNIDETITNDKNQITDENNKIKVTEETKASSDFIEDKTPTDDEKDVIEVMDESLDASDHCERELHPPTQKEKDDIEIIEESQDSSAQHEDETQASTLKEKDNIEVIEESQNATVQCEKESEPHMTTEKDEVEVIEELNNSSVASEMETESSMPEEKMNAEVTIETEKCEDRVHSLIENSKHSNMELVTEDKIDSDDIVKDITLICEDNIIPAIAKEKDENTIHTQVMAETAQSENSSDLSIKEDNGKTESTEEVNEGTIPSENDPDIAIEEKEEVEVIEDEDVNSVKNENKTESSSEITADTNNSPKDIEIRSNNAMNSIKPFKSESAVEVSNKDDASAILKDVAMDVEEMVESSNIMPEAVDSPIELRDDMDVEEVVEKTSSNNNTAAAPEVKVATSVNNSPIELRDDMDVEEVVEKTSSNNNTAAAPEVKVATSVNNSPIELRDDIDVEEVVEKTSSNNNTAAAPEVKVATSVNNSPVNNIIDKPIVCKLSNTLDILSDDDEDEPPKEEPSKVAVPEVEPPKENCPEEAETKEKQCINIEDDDDIMLIDEETKTGENTPVGDKKEEIPTIKSDVNTDSEMDEKTVQESSNLEKNVQTETTPPPLVDMKASETFIDDKEKTPEPTIAIQVPPTPLVSDDFLNTEKKKIADMTRDEIEEFCILKIVESIADRSSLSDIKNKLRTMTQGLEEYRKKAMMLTKQNRDLQVVLKSVQEEQKKSIGDTPITPLKITRSVGMQVFMEKTIPRKKIPQQNPNNKPTNNPQTRNVMSQALRPQKSANQQIPVPRLVPASNPALKPTCALPHNNQMNTQGKISNPANGMIKNPSPAAKAEKRQHNKTASSSVTVDLTDDEPPAKMPGGSKSSPAPPVRLVPPQNLMAPQRQAMSTSVNSPRKVYIPISGPQNQALRPGQTIMLKTVPATGMRPRCPTPQVTRVGSNALALHRTASRHPAPLPNTAKQYQPPNWKPLPPAPDLKLSKVENGIVISWKIDGMPEDAYEEVASYQLYAYQETSTPPNTDLWKKIGDVKALPLPMACTLTQFMSGFKYYFAVRAIDVKSRVGPFSLPGSILLLSKNM